MRFRSILLFLTMPAVVTGLGYEWFLGHRHDYSGHYLAGYGATLAAAVGGLSLIPAGQYARWAPRLMVPFCVLCILGGVVTEATVFRLARFDEIDFFNQSLGAVLAMLCVSAMVTDQKSGPMVWISGLTVGLGFLMAGGILAFS